MQVRLDQVRQEPFSWQETLAVSAEALERPDLIDLGPVVCRGEMVFAPPAFLFRAHLSYELTLPCIRCLCPIREPISSEVELMVVSEKEKPSGDPDLALNAEDLSIVYVEEQVLDTEPLFVEQLQLNIPMKPLCRPDCKGLCPECGAELNLGSCQCRTPPQDPRWVALEALRNDLATREDQEPPEFGK